MRFAGYALLVSIAFLLILPLPPQGILRDPETFRIIPSPFLNGIVPLLALSLLIPAILYGKVAGTIQTDKDIAQEMGEAMSKMGYYIALTFVASQFLSNSKFVVRPARPGIA